MTPPDAPERGPASRPDRIPRKGFFELLPTRNLVRAVVLLALLLVIVMFQRRSGHIGKMIAESLFPPPPARSTAPRAPGPTVRMAPPVAERTGATKP